MDAKLAIRRQTTIPKSVNKRNVLAVIEVGGKMVNKDYIYQRVWEIALPQLEKELKEKLKDIGSDQYDKLYKRACMEVSNG